MPYCFETFAQPLGALAVCQSAERNTGIAKALFLGQIERYLYSALTRCRRDWRQSRHLCTDCFSFFQRKIGSHITRHAKVRCGIYAVGRNINGNKPIFLQMEPFSRRRSGLGFGRQNHNAALVRSHADFRFAADHSHTHLSAQLTFFDGIRLVAVV